jgi:hypothetical protein
MSKFREKFSQKKGPIPTATVFVDYLESDVEARALTRAGREEFYKYCKDVPDQSLRDAKMVVLCCFENGERVFSDDDMGDIAENYYMFQKVIEKITALSNGESGKAG